MKHSFTAYLTIVLLLIFITAYTFSQAGSRNAGDKVAIEWAFGESWGSYGKFPSAITENEWKPLKTQIIYTQEGKTEAKEFIRFKSEGITGCTQVFTEDEEGNTGNFLRCPRNTVIWEAQVQFSNGLESKIENNILADLDNLDLNLFGSSYSLLNSKINTDTDTIELRFVGGRESGRKYFMKESQTLGLGSTSISPVIISESGRVVFQIGGKNGYKTKDIGEGEAIILDDGSVIGVDKILINEAGEETGGEDTVEFHYANGFTGGGSLRIKDVYSDSVFNQGSQFAGSNSPYLYVRIDGYETSTDKFRINNIYFRLISAGISGGDVYVSSGKTIAESHKDRISADLIPITYVASGAKKIDGAREQRRTAQGNVIFIDRRGRDSYIMQFMNNQGQSYAVPLFNENLNFGDSNGNALYFDESESNTDFKVDRGDYLIMTNANTKTGITRILRFESIDATNKVVYFDDIATGRVTTVLRSTDISGALGEGFIISGGTSYGIVAKKDGSSIAVDLTGDGQFNGEESDIVVFGGGRFELGSGQLTLVTDSSLFDEPSGDEEIEIDFTSSSGTLNADVNDQSGLDMHDVGSGGITLGIPGISINEGDDAGMSNYGVLIAVLDNNEDVAISYPIGGSRAFSVGVSTKNTVGQNAGAIIIG